MIPRRRVGAPRGAARGHDIDLTRRARELRLSRPPSLLRVIPCLARITALTAALTVALTVALTSAMTTLSGPAFAGPEWRALWVPADHLVTPKATEQAIETAVQLGMTDLLVQVRTRGDALYRSAYVPASRALTSRSGPASITLRDDPLLRFVDLAHARGLRVHAWFNVFVAWSQNGPPPAGHVLDEHPDWAVRLADGRSTLALTADERRAASLEGAFLAPGLREVRTHLVDLVQELARYYPIDGIHFDYVRYPSARCVDPGERLPMQSAEPESLRAARQRDAVSAFVQSSAREVRRTRPGIIVSAAVFPEPADSRTGVRQDWVRWLREGWIDRAIPMAYTESVDRLEDLRKRWDRAGADSLRVVTGLAVYRNDGVALEKQILWARRRSPGGVALFALEHLFDPPSRMRAVRRSLPAGQPYSTSNQ